MREPAAVFRRRVESRILYSAIAWEPPYCVRLNYIDNCRRGAVVILGGLMFRVRFAPSPTGYLHIGSARTFIFNWLYARHNGATMILRIDDTDVERNTQASLDSIYEGFRWLDLRWDEFYR